MRTLSKRRKRFLGITQDYLALYSYTNSKEQLVVSAGVLNFIWNSWNNFWRDYWLAHVTGGMNLDGTPLIPTHPTYIDKQGCHYLLFLLRKRKSHNLGDAISSCHQEATWGDPKIISDLSTALLSSHAHLATTLGVLSHYYTDIVHIQKIRNSFIHLNNENVFNLNPLTAYYSFSAPQKKPIDILEAKNIRSSQRCIDHLVDNVRGMIYNL
ncbi:hypothetical protein [Chitinophaga sp. XS-30]|uniref:hypothetical protein n=1 Tax=Chitinophaga sp. XS-30 TaxID=2604421 RepID=UPI0011DD315A|nr:hypothetical protein [Chitinophaga sp. XS-30]QEH39355.1 hypothetical protein FW415_00090 [Chitinophaga sp. XS-30]